MLQLTSPITDALLSRGSQAKESMVAGALGGLSASNLGAAAGGAMAP